MKMLLYGGTGRAAGEVVVTPLLPGASHAEMNGIFQSHKKKRKEVNTSQTPPLIRMLI